MSLNDLSDVSISGTLEDGMLLQYNASTSGGTPYWEAVSLADVLAGQDIGGGGNSNVSIVDSLNNITSPNENDIAVVSGDVYVYDGSDWIQFTNSDLEDRLSALETAVGTPAEGQSPATGLFKDIEDLEDALDNVYTKSEIQQYISGLSHLKYEVVTSLQDIDVTDDDATTTVYLVPKTESGSSDGYDEYFVVNGSLEKIGSWGADLTDYVQTTDNRLLTQAQKDKLDTITLDGQGGSSFSGTITASQVTDLNQAIASNQLIKSVESGTFNVDSNGHLTLVGIPTSVLDLSDYVTTATVGNLSSLTNRVSANSTIVDEINYIKESVIWTAIPTDE